jgi:hypothetical protein
MDAREIILTRRRLESRINSSASLTEGGDLGHALA